MNHWFGNGFPSINQTKFLLKNAYPVFLEDCTFINFYYNSVFLEPYFLQLFFYSNPKKVLLSKKVLQRKGLEQFEITVYGASTEGKVVNQLWDKLQKFKQHSFHLNTNFSNGRDGAIVELSIGKFYHQTTFQWWTADPPKDWEAIFELRKCIEEIDRLANYGKKLSLAPKIEMIPNGKNVDENARELYVSYEKKGK